LNNNVIHKAECLDNVEGKRANVTCGPGFGIDSKLAKVQHSSAIRVTTMVRDACRSPKII